MTTTTATVGGIDIDAVSHEFRPRRGRNSGAAPSVVLEDINLSVRPGEFLVVVGPSGCGKTTLMEAIAGLTIPTGGQIRVDGSPVTGPGLDRGIVFQQYALFPWLTAQRNIEFSLEAKGGWSRAERKQRAAEYLALVGLEGAGHKYPHELSGGMKQRVAIGRSLAYDPAILLMDEPFAALDAQTRESLQGELYRLWRTTAKTIVFITHSIDEAVFLGQRVAVMSGRPGRIKQLVDVPLDPDLRADETQDFRSLPEFVQIRKELWGLLHDSTHHDQEVLAS